MRLPPLALPSESADSCSWHKIDLERGQLISSNHNAWKKTGVNFGGINACVDTAVKLDRSSETRGANFVSLAAKSP